MNFIGVLERIILGGKSLVKPNINVVSTYGEIYNSEMIIIIKTMEVIHNHKYNSQLEPSNNTQLMQSYAPAIAPTNFSCRKKISNWTDDDGDTRDKGQETVYYW